MDMPRHARDKHEDEKSQRRGGGSRGDVNRDHVRRTVVEVRRCPILVKKKLGPLATLPAPQSFNFIIENPIIQFSCMRKEGVVRGLSWQINPFSAFIASTGFYSQESSPSSLLFSIPNRNETACFFSGALFGSVAVLSLSWQSQCILKLSTP